MLYKSNPSPKLYAPMAIPEFRISSMCAVSIFFVPFFSSLSRTAKTSIGGLRPRRSARCQRFIRVIPTHGLSPVSTTQSDLLQRMEGTYSELRAHVEVSQHFLTQREVLLMNSRCSALLLD